MIYVVATTDDCDGVAVIDTTSKAVIATYPLAFTVATLTVSPRRCRERCRMRA